MNPADAWNRHFPGCDDWDDPRVVNKIRKHALSVLYSSVRGKAKIPKEQLESARFAVARLIADQAPRNVQVNFIQWKDIAQAVERAGLSKQIQVPKKQLAAEKVIDQA